MTTCREGSAGRRTLTQADRHLEQAHELNVLDAVWPKWAPSSSGPREGEGPPAASGQPRAQGQECREGLGAQVGWVQLCGSGDDCRGGVGPA